MKKILTISTILLATLPVSASYGGAHDLGNALPAGGEIARLEMPEGMITVLWRGADSTIIRDHGGRHFIVTDDGDIRFIAHNQQNEEQI